ncbi:MULTISPECIES: glycosyltransferase family 2 protein [unclassified Pseudactinotalea]|uniref:glycosyltransferase family 2 protein n=1 Tax=Micrococcales TaxID=85006 RepID=UPI003C79EF09
MSGEQPSSERRRPLRVIRRRTAGRAARAEASGQAREQRVAVVIPAKDEAERIAETVYAVRAIPYVDLVLVVDDGSEDDTQHAARAAGAVVVRHSQNRGKASAMETGASVVAMRDLEDGPARLLLFVDADLGATAVNVAPLVPPIVAGRADMSIAVLPPQAGAGGRGLVTGRARKAIQRATGWTPRQPLSGQRCMTREAFDAATPLARGWGVEVGMSIDVLMQGFAVVEVPCDLRHRPSGNDLRGQLHRAAQYRDVAVAIATRRFRHYKQKVVREIDTAETAQGGIVTATSVQSGPRPEEAVVADVSEPAEGDGEMTEHVGETAADAAQTAGSSQAEGTDRADDGAPQSVDGAAHGDEGAKAE